MIIVGNFGSLAFDVVIVDEASQATEAEVSRNNLFYVHWSSIVMTHFLINIKTFFDISLNLLPSLIPSHY